MSDFWREALHEAPITTKRITHLEGEIANLCNQLRIEKEKNADLAASLAYSESLINVAAAHASANADAAIAFWKARAEKAEAAEQASKANLTNYIEVLKYNLNTIGAERDSLRKENADLRKACTQTVPDPVKPLWAPKHGRWSIDSFGEVRDGDDEITPATANVFTRTSEKQAEGAAKAMRAFNRLLAYRDDVEPDFYSYKEGYLYHPYMRTNGCWRVQKAWSDVAIPLRVAFVSRENCEVLCEKLNSGEVVL